MRNYMIPHLTISHSFLATILPILTLCTHTLLALSFALPGSDQYHAFWSLVYNVLAAGSSMLGLIGAIRVCLPPRLSSGYRCIRMAQSPYNES
jgi:hypothetical protein